LHYVWRPPSSIKRERHINNPLNKHVHLAVYSGVCLYSKCIFLSQFTVRVCLLVYSSPKWRQASCMFLRLHFSSWQKSSRVLRLPFLFVFTQPSQLSSEGSVRRASESCGASHTEPLRRRPDPRGTPVRRRASLLFLRCSTLLLPDLRRDSARWGEPCRWGVH
jgi:hypothetical protein